MGWQDFLLGASTNPADYTVETPNQRKVASLIDQAFARRTSTSAPLYTDATRARALQGDQAQRLADVAAGNAQGAGELAVQRQAANAAAGQQALASMRGAGGLGARQAARQTAAIGSSAAGMGQQAALQDRAAAEAALTGALGSARGQDIGVAQMNQQASLANTAQNNQMYMQLLGQLTGMDHDTLWAQIAQMQAAQNKPGALGTLLGAGGQVLGSYLGARK